jgi:FMN-dependent NADH-azoreductase
MAKLLYITCDLQPVEHSRSLYVGSWFLNEYLKWNPEDEIQMLDLYRDNIQRVDADVLSGLGKMHLGHHYAGLTPDEQRKIGRIWRLADQFIAADKYVFVTPMQNLGFPAELWMYMDAVFVVDKTYRLTLGGPEGLLKNQRRKCLLIHTTNGFDLGEKEAPWVSYIRTKMNFMGVEAFESIAVKGAYGIPEKASECIGEEIKAAVVECAARF